MNATTHPVRPPAHTSPHSDPLGPGETQRRGSSSARCGSGSQSCTEDCIRGRAVDPGRHVPKHSFHTVENRDRRTSRPAPALYAAPAPQRKIVVGAGAVVGCSRNSEQVEAQCRPPQLVHLRLRRTEGPREPTKSVSLFLFSGQPPEPPLLPRRAFP